MANSLLRYDKKRFTLSTFRMIHALCSASNLRARAEKIKKPLFKQTHKVTFHIITSLGVVFSLSTLISKLSRAKIIGSSNCRLLFDWLIQLGSAKVTKVGGIRKIMVLCQAVKYHSTILQRLRCQISLNYYTIPPATRTQAKVIIIIIGHLF